MKKLQGKWALVTGSSRGIGRQVALGLAREGCGVIVHGREEAHCAETVRLLENLGAEVRVTAGDLGTREGTRAVIEGVRSMGVEVDILYNNAGIISAWSDSAFDIPVEEWNRVFAVNVHAVAELCNALIPPMVARGWGRVVNVTSGIKGRPQRAPYGASKAAVDKFSADLAVELEGRGVMISTLDPGWVKTEIGGERAPNEATSVLPGALIPVLLEDSEKNGQFFEAQNYR